MVASLLLSMFLGQSAEMPRWVRIAEPPGIEVQLRLESSTLAKLPVGEIAADDAKAFLRVVLLHPKTGQPGPDLFGTFRKTEKGLSFRPRFSLEPGLKFRASAGEREAVDFVAPAKEFTSAPPRVTGVYPTGKILPANVLRFYIYFSAPIQGGSDVFKQIQILGPDGQIVEDPWLVEEIWDEASQCLIIYIHPGRIKWGVSLRETLGPVFLPDRDYQLVIRKELKDVDGRSMAKDHVVTFRTSAEDRKAIPFSKWKVNAPVAGSTQPVEIEATQALDHRSVRRWIKLRDAKGLEIEGSAMEAHAERKIRFTPKQPWQPGAYTVEIDRRFEDVAGNLPTRPFDADLTAAPPVNQELRLPFQIR